MHFATDPGVSALAPSATLKRDDVRALAVRSHGLTDRGRVRPTNEDHFLIAELTKVLWVHQSSLPQPAAQYGEERGHLFVVADGMGGHRAGEHASAMAIQTIEEFVLKSLAWFFGLRGPTKESILTEFQSALRLADARVVEASRTNSDLQQMGTTLTMAYSVGLHLYVVHVGDSRCYLLRGGHLYQLTHDHTYVQEMLRRGLITTKEAATHHMRHVIMNAVGGGQPGVAVETHRLDLDVDDSMLLCSDGLHGILPDDQIASILAAGAAPQAACERLIAAANEAGGHDNITAVVAHFDKG